MLTGHGKQQNTFSKGQEERMYSEACEGRIFSLTLTFLTSNSWADYIDALIDLMFGESVPGHFTLQMRRDLCLKAQQQLIDSYVSRCMSLHVGSQTDVWQYLLSL